MKSFKDLGGILLIDDDLPTNFIHTKIIEKSNIVVKIKAITNVEEALEFLTFSGRYRETENIPRPGLIFLDINMPGLNGWDFLDAYELLEDNYKATAVILMLTTSLNPDDRDRALKVGVVSAFINKPLQPDLVEEIVNKYFELQPD